MQFLTKTISNTQIEPIIIALENCEYENLIVDLSLIKKVSQKEINLFLPIAKSFKKNNCSFVIVIQDIDFNRVSDKINVVPSLQEAHDIIEMEEIERDLGI
jgi:hypothetical protein